MRQYVLRRLLALIPILFGVTIITFTMTELMPGDFVTAMVPPDSASTMTPEQLKDTRAAFGLDKPAHERYLAWLREVARGNLGYSFLSGQPVLWEILRRLPATLELTVTALVFGVVVGVALGIISAVRQYSWLDQVLTVLGFVWISTPGFVFAIGAIYLFSLKMPLFPTVGSGPYGESVGLLTRLHYMVLPAAVLGLHSVAGFMRYTRSSLLDVIRQDYVTVARAKGLSESTVLLAHALRNALIPIITILGLNVPLVLGGAIIVETIFAWPGMGLFSFSSIGARDYPVIMGVNFIMALAVLTSNLLTDIAYALADPRVHYG